MSRLTNRTNEIRRARCHRYANHDEAVTIAKLPHLALERGYPDKSQKRLAARRASRTAPETAVMATILTRLWVAIDSVEDTKANVRFAFAFLRFDFCDARIAFPRRRVRLLGSLTLTLSLSRFVPDLRAIMTWLRT